MPAIRYRKVEITIEYDTASTITNGELADRITRPVEEASRDLAKDPESGIRSYRVKHTWIADRPLG